MKGKGSKAKQDFKSWIWDVQANLCKMHEAIYSFALYNNIWKIFATI